MPIYEYKCPIHGKFESILFNDNFSMPCPLCGEKSQRMLSHIAQIKVIHIEHLPTNAPERIEDRQKLREDTSVKKALKKYRDEAFETMRGKND